MFTDNEDKCWFINSGGGTEIQYHLTLRDTSVQYGLGFNTEYVPYVTNKKTAVEFMKPFMQAYLNKKEELEPFLKDTEFIRGTEDDIINPKPQKYILRGKKIPFTKRGNRYYIEPTNFEGMIDDIKKWLEPYKIIFEERNKLMEEGAAMKETVEQIENLLKSNYNLVLTGAPGTGKTYLAYELAMKLTGSKTRKSEHIKFVQFHPSYDYTDFVEGIKPSGKISNGIELDVKKGIFKKFCEKALDAWKEDKDKEKTQQRKFVFIIDEINRADLSRVFGELFFGLEADYRGEEIITQYSYLQGGSNLVIPKNLYIIGTMNDIDRSVESMDFALRRRFVWKEISAESSESIIDSADISKELKEQAKTRMNNLNAKILEIFGSRAYQIGGAYFKKLELYKEDDNSGFPSLWENHLANVLREYLRGDKNLEDKVKDLKMAYDNEQQNNGNTE